VPKTLKEQVEDMLDIFTDTNPYYITTRINHKIFTKKPNADITFKLPNKQDTRIKIIIPMNPKKKSLDYFFAYTGICYNNGSLFDWEATLRTLDGEGILFVFSHKRAIIKIKGHRPVYKENLYVETEKIFHTNQNVRFQMKRLVYAWLNKRCKNRVIGEDSDLITGDAIPPAEQIRIISVINRTTYVFSGHVLLKSAKSCLEGQTGAIPHVKTPHNPYTNTPFTYGELVKVYGEILMWCAKKGKALPGIIGLYREYKFKNNMLLRVNHNYIQWKATENYILNDDTNGDFFIEAMQLILDDNIEILEIEFDSMLIGYQRFRLWNIIEPKSHLVLSWKKLASDYWYYKQTEHYPRENWRSDASIYIDISILVRASLVSLEKVGREYYRRRALNAQL
jgi:hypothetical protein